MEFVPPIAGKGFVRPVARKSHRHVFARQCGNGERRQGRGIGERLVIDGSQAIDRRPILGRDPARMVIGIEQLRNLFGVAAFVERGDIEADRTGGNRCGARFGHQRDDRRAVDPARQERAQRHIGDHPAAHGLAHQMKQFGFEIFGLVAAAGREAHIPPLARFGQRRIVSGQQEMPGHQFAHMFEDRPMFGHEPPGQEILDRVRIDLAPQRRMGEQALHFGRESYAAIGQIGDEERFHPQPVAGEKQLALVQIVNREGEHAVEAREAIGAPALPGGEDDFAIALGPKTRALILQFAPQRAVIVDLAIEGKHGAAIRRGHGLRRSRHIDDRQAAMAEPDSGGSPHARAVRPAMGQRRAHLLDPRGIDRLGRAMMKNPRDPAHGPWPTRPRRCGPAIGRADRWRRGNRL